MYVYNIYIYVVISYLYPHTHTLLDTLSSVLNTEIYGSPAVSEHHIEKTMTEHPPSFPSLALHSCTIPPKKTLLGHPRNSCSATPEELAMAVQEWLGYPKWLFCNMPTFNGNMMINQWILFQMFKHSLNKVIKSCDLICFHISDLILNSSMFLHVARGWILLNIVEALLSVVCHSACHEPSAAKLRRWLVWRSLASHPRSLEGTVGIFP